MEPNAPYRSVDEKPDFPAIEQRILELWAEKGTFAESIDQRVNDDEYVFYDGPPFANGLPHHGHLLTGYVKDVVPRYQTMRGHKVDRRFGWDCHGLPAEMEAEKELPVSGRADIIEYGIARFNDYCRTSVLRYAGEWEKTVTRQARWVDFENDYKTMDHDYMESLIWAFSELWRKGLIYEAYRVMPYSWGAETPLSNSEIRLDDATRPRQDPAITVAFDLEPADGDPGPLRILAWTTTPWTLPSNLALAVAPDVIYSVVAHDGANYVLAADARDRYEPQLGGGEIVATMRGTDLVGRRYTPLFDYFADMSGQGAYFSVVSADFIDTDDGTGVVHMAPGFGEDDHVVCESNGIELTDRFVPVDDQGRFTDVVTDWAGDNVFDANPVIIRYLKDAGHIVRHDTYEHNYPHCWRTDTPIIYRAMNSWYVEVTAIRDRLMELNQQINWVPDHVRDGRFGMWLEGARDWSISRNRFWGTPLPVWRSDNPDYPRIDVYGSLDEIEADFGVRPDDLHRPTIDELVRPNPDDPSGESMMRRIPEVLDCWFESGSMPFAQVHYPFENKEWFETHFPADFIVEYINQTRGWFYTLHVLAGALFDRPAFQNVICHGILLAEDGDKLSKRLRNYTEPEEIFNRQGADALRWYFMSNPIVRGGDTRISDAGIDDVVRQVLLPVWNAYRFFVQYANIDGHRAQVRTDATDVLDRYILAKTREMVVSVTESMDAYDLPGAAGHLHGFIDALNNWYIRRSRDRFWAPAGDQNNADKADAYDTLFTVMTTFARAAAPFLPLVMEEIYRGLHGTEDVSVHLTDWPDPSDLPDEHDLVAAMDLARDVCSTTLALREAEGLRVRLPLAKLTVAGTGAAALGDFTDLVADEVNVKEVALTASTEGPAAMVLRPDGKVLGPRLGGDVQTVFAAARDGEWSRNDDGSISIAGHTLTEGEFELAVEADGDTTASSLNDHDGLVVLDTDLSPELEAEGLARDVVRHVQQARKDADLIVTDRIDLHLDLPDHAARAVKAHERYVADQVLATDVVYGPIADGLVASDIKISDESARIGLRVADSPTVSA